MRWWNGREARSSVRNRMEKRLEGLVQISEELWPGACGVGKAQGALSPRLPRRLRCVQGGLLVVSAEVSLWRCSWDVTAAMGPPHTLQ